MKDTIANAQDVFSRNLPDPLVCSSSTITFEKSIGIRRVTFIAQKVKNNAGYSWDIYCNTEISPMKKAMCYYHNFS